MKLVSLTLLLFCFTFISCTKDNINCTPSNIQFSQNEKIKGANFNFFSATNFSEEYPHVINVNAEWVAIIYFGYLNTQTDSIQFYHNWKDEDAILEAKSIELKVMIKPQIRIDHGNIFTGDYELHSEAEWVQFENMYRNFMMPYVQLAISTEAEVLCIGNEWKQFVLKRNGFWYDFIDEIKLIYNGKITYASNWDEYKDVPFWDRLDFIGVNAYFSISNSHTPSVTEIENGWKSHLKKLGGFACDNNKQIVFTEYGYRSTNYCALKPWDDQELVGEEHLNFQAQSNAYEGFYKALWNKDWFAGGFLWVWLGADDYYNGTNDNNFTPQNKPAEEIVKSYYGSL